MTNETPAAPTEPTPTPVPAAKKRGASRIITPILALVAALAIGLFGGVLIGHATATSATPARAGFGQGTGGTGAAGGGGFRGGAGGTGTGGATGGTGGTGGAAGGAFGGFTSGTVVSVSGDTITLKEASGTTVQVTTTGSTAVTKTEKSSVSKLTAGEQLTVIGKADSSGNVAATTITEGQAGFRGGARPGGAQGGAGASN
jgi:hypothetical protein